MCSDIQLHIRIFSSKNLSFIDNILEIFIVGILRSQKCQLFDLNEANRSSSIIQFLGE